MNASSGDLTVDGRERPADTGVGRAPLFYGWLMLPQAMLAHVLTVPGQTLGIAVFNSSLIASLAISETQLTGAYGLGTLLAAAPLAALGAGHGSARESAAR